MSLDDPYPLPREALERALAALTAGVPYKAALEALLLELDDEAADRLMQLQREARGTWFLALRVPAPEQVPARALVLGNALSGTGVTLARHGFDVTFLDSSPLRLAWAKARSAALAPHSDTRTLLADGGARLSFEERAFELVVQEDGLPTPARGWGHDLTELRRITRGELLVVADNRLGYKRSTGRRGRFDVPSPLAYLGRVLRGPERTLAGYRRLLRSREFAAPRSFALYPHASEFTFLVGLDARTPSLELGPKERANRAKLAAHELGLFPVLAPSFALLASRSELAPRPARWDALLAGIERATGERCGVLEHVVATRGNTALLLTRAEASANSGAWCIHVGLSAAQCAQLGTHARMLRHVAAHHPRCPVPQLLFDGELEGLRVTVERRARGLTAPQLTGDLAATRRTLDALALALAGLAARPARELDEAEFERLLGARFDVVAAHCGHSGTRAALEHLRGSAREEWLGLRFPLVVQHADLRSKHVQVERDGGLVAVLDWGSAEEADLPGFDLLHYLLHERKQAEGLAATAMWQLALEPQRLRDWERAALQSYASALELPPGYFPALARVYPVLVAAMAERHWDYSRPRWLRRQFGIGAP